METSAFLLGVGGNPYTSPEWASGAARGGPVASGHAHDEASGLEKGSGRLLNGAAAPAVARPPGLSALETEAEVLAAFLMATAPGIPPPQPPSRRTRASGSGLQPPAVISDGAPALGHVSLHAKPASQTGLVRAPSAARAAPTPAWPGAAPSGGSFKGPAWGGPLEPSPRPAPLARITSSHRHKADILLTPKTAPALAWKDQDGVGHLLNTGTWGPEGPPTGEAGAWAPTGPPRARQSAGGMKPASGSANGTAGGDPAPAIGTSGGAGGGGPHAAMSDWLAARWNVAAAAPSGRGRRASVVQTSAGGRTWALEGGPGPRIAWHHRMWGVWGWLDKVLPLFLPSPRRAAWDVMLLFALLYTAIAVPLQAGFTAAVSPALDACHYVVLAMFWIDICVQFRTAYVNDSGELVRDTSEIAKHYARTWLGLDLISSIPWAEILEVVLGGGSRASVLIALTRLPRLLRLMRLVRQLDRWRYANALRLARLIGLVMLVSHWTACAWHGLSEWLDAWPWLFTAPGVSAYGSSTPLLTPYSSLFAQYTTVMYYSYVLVVGADNISAFNNLERAFFIVMLVAGSVLYALVISNMAVLVANLNSLSARYSTRAALAADALRYMGAPESHRERVAEYYDFLIQHEHPGPDADAFLSELPRGLVDDIRWSLYSHLLAGLPLFLGCDEPFMAALQSRLTLAAFTVGEEVYRAGDIGQHMCILRRGCVLLCNPLGELETLLQPGEAFGELALLPDLAARRREATAVAAAPTDVVCLAARDLAAVCKDHPASGALIMERLSLKLRDQLYGSTATWFQEYDAIYGLSAVEGDSGYDIDTWIQSGGHALLVAPDDRHNGSGGAGLGGTGGTSGGLGGGLTAEAAAAISAAAVSSFSRSAISGSLRGGKAAKSTGDGTGAVSASGGSMSRRGTGSFHATRPVSLVRPARVNVVAKPATDLGELHSESTSDDQGDLRHNVPQRDGHGERATRPDVVVDVLGASRDSSASSWASFMEATGVASRTPSRVAMSRGSPAPRVHADSDGKDDGGEVRETALGGRRGPGALHSDRTARHVVDLPPLGAAAPVVPPLRAPAGIQGMSESGGAEDVAHRPTPASRVTAAKAAEPVAGIGPKGPSDTVAPMLMTTADVALSSFVATAQQQLPSPPTAPMPPPPAPPLPVQGATLLGQGSGGSSSAAGIASLTVIRRQPSGLSAAATTVAASAAASYGASRAGSFTGRLAARVPSARVLPLPQQLASPDGMDPHAPMPPSAFATGFPDLDDDRTSLSRPGTATATARLSRSIRKQASRLNFVTPSPLHAVNSDHSLSGHGGSALTERPSAAAGQGEGDDDDGTPKRVPSVRRLRRLASSLLKRMGGGGNSASGESPALQQTSSVPLSPGLSHRTPSDSARRQAPGGSAGGGRPSSEEQAQSAANAATGNLKRHRSSVRRNITASILLPSASSAAPPALTRPASARFNVASRRHRSALNTGCDEDWGLLASTPGMAPREDAHDSHYLLASTSALATSSTRRDTGVGMASSSSRLAADPVAAALQTLAEALGVGQQGQGGPSSRATSHGHVPLDLGALHAHAVHPKPSQPQPAAQPWWGPHGSLSSGPGWAADRRPASVMGMTTTSAAAAAAAAAAVAAAAVQAVTQPPQALQGQSHRAAMLAIADAIVRQYGATSVPAVREALAERTAAVEARMGQALEATSSGLTALEAKVVELDDSTMAAKRRIIAIEELALEAVGDGVLAPQLAGLLDTSEQLELAMAARGSTGSTGPGVQRKQSRGGLDLGVAGGSPTLSEGEALRVPSFAAAAAGGSARAASSGPYPRSRHDSPVQSSAGVGSGSGALGVGSGTNSQLGSAVAAAVSWASQYPSTLLQRARSRSFRVSTGSAASDGEGTAALSNAASGMSEVASLAAMPMISRKPSMRRASSTLRRNSVVLDAIGSAFGTANSSTDSPRGSGAGMFANSSGPWPPGASLSRATSSRRASTELQAALSRAMTSDLGSGSRRSSAELSASNVPTGASRGAGALSRRSSGGELSPMPTRTAQSRRASVDMSRAAALQKEASSSRSPFGSGAFKDEVPPVEPPGPGNGTAAMDAESSFKDTSVRSGTAYYTGVPASSRYGGGSAGQLGSALPSSALIDAALERLPPVHKNSGGIRQALGAGPWPTASSPNWSTVLDDSIVQDGGGGRNGKQTLLPSERPGARRAPAAAPRTSDAMVETSAMSARSGYSRTGMPFKRSSTSNVGDGSSGMPIKRSSTSNVGDGSSGMPIKRSSTSNVGDGSARESRSQPGGNGASEREQRATEVTTGGGGEKAAPQPRPAGRTAAARRADGGGGGGGGGGRAGSSGWSGARSASGGNDGGLSG
ncbi:hypothetical protein HYH03_017864 [Edaphochlamys debaryana]|uniref:Cyclic nucleotide-binding domain-containing protein n=1 Tax=Edaphochlamys debaryana TaxID=47281 RepID=A0A836BNH6_9CHLO|nr:hypothetical protein HYH03_017864 [Edaphochlamys debaryana]|eukprot:KAG2483266.1 hypothetical protein HYH03_017864 [Edaphochlamys debaryana]